MWREIYSGSSVDADGNYCELHTPLYISKLNKNITIFLEIPNLIVII